MRIDLNADVGESFGAYALGQDPGIMPFLTSANIACGFHAGDPAVMRTTVALARRYGVAVGAHPGLPDLVGFGRRRLAATPREIEDMVLYQVGALAGIAAAEGARLRHVKPHGALYTMAATNAEVADAVARATASIDSTLVLFGLAGSLLIEAGERAGLRVAREAFSDRAYTRDGSLQGRETPGAVIRDADLAARRAVSIVRDGAVVTVEGARLAIAADTICVHGDTLAAAAIAAAVRAALEAAGADVRAISA